jgi:hypothetical protein
LNEFALPRQLNRYVAYQLDEECCMPVFTRAYQPIKCPKCKVTYNRWSVKVHKCGPRANPDEPTENRPELHHRDAVRAAIAKRHARTNTRPITVRGTATVDVLLPTLADDKPRVSRRKTKRNVERKL